MIIPHSSGFESLGGRGGGVASRCRQLAATSLQGSQGCMRLQLLLCTPGTWHSASLNTLEAPQQYNEA